MPHVNQVPPVRSPGAHATGRVRIVSDGLVRSTQVLLPDGTPLPNVQAVEILNLHAGNRNEAVMARITLSMVGVDVVAARLSGAAESPGAAARCGPLRPREVASARTPCRFKCKCESFAFMGGP